MYKYNFLAPDCTLTRTTAVVGRESTLAAVVVMAVPEVSKVGREVRKSDELVC